MAFKLPKTKGDIFGINEELSEWGRPVFEKNLDKGIIAEANNDGTTFVNKNASEKEKEDSIAHENKHHDQMKQGKLYYDDNKVIWKRDTKTGARVYMRDQGNIVDVATNKAEPEGGNFEWEDEARAAE
jgi:hypothetical protein